MTGHPWFRMYASIVGDPVVQALSFENQRHYVMLLALKCDGLLDRDVPSKVKMMLIAKGLNVSPGDLKEIKESLREFGLIDSNMQPIGWEKRQFRDRHGEPGRGAKDAKAYIYFIGQEGAGEVKIGYSKNPWARVKDFQTATTGELRVLATVATTESSEIATARLFTEQNIKGEWYRRDEVISSVIKEIQGKRLKTDRDVESYVSNYVVTTKEQNRSEQIPPYSPPLTSGGRGSRLPPDWSLPDDWRAWAESEGLTRAAIDRQAEQFADYWHGAAGAKGRKADWFATWRNWIRRDLPEPAKRSRGLVV